MRAPRPLSRAVRGFGVTPGSYDVGTRSIKADLADERTRRTRTRRSRRRRRCPGRWWGVGRRGDKGVPGEATGNGSTLTGSGPASWAHDGTPAGIHDLVGNVSEWVTGLKLINGRVWLAPDNGKNEESAYIDTGFDLTAGVFSATSNIGASNLVKQSLIVPATAALAPTGQVYVDATTERLPLRGGNWNNAGSAGLGCLFLSYARTSPATSVGLRPRFRVL